jgi:hypothetical protein
MQSRKTSGRVHSSCGHLVRSAPALEALRETRPPLALFQLALEVDATQTTAHLEADRLPNVLCPRTFAGGISGMPQTRRQMTRTTGTHVWMRA